MDRVTEAFISEFITEHELSRLSPDKQFEHFAAYVTPSVANATLI